MREFKWIWLPAMIAIGLISTSLASAQGHLQSAIGAGRFSDPAWGGEYCSFALSAFENSDFTCTGRLEIKDRYQQLVIRMEVEALCVWENVAGIAGTITKCDADPACVGNWGALAIVDNGQGKNALPDQITDLCLFTPSPYGEPRSAGYLAVMFASAFPFGATIFDVDVGSILVR